MCLKDLVDWLGWVYVQAYLQNIFPEKRMDLLNHRNVFLELQQMRKSVSNKTLTIFKDEERPLKSIPSLKVLGICNDGNTTGELTELGRTPWAEWLGMTVDPFLLQSHREIEIICHCLVAMTRYGFDEEDIANSKNSRIENLWDFDGNMYRTVHLGDQVWMAENLKAKSLGNGDEILEAHTHFQWELYNHSRLPACCCYDFDPLNLNRYGLLYNWYTVSDPRGILSGGWHVPNNTDWQALFKSLGGPEVAGTHMRPLDSIQKSLRCKKSSGFKALPGGARVLGAFSGMEETCCWWSRNESLTHLARSYELLPDGRLFHGHYLKTSGFSVRMVKNKD
jgi:uncharacterized protein (TIGR02145 family)